MKFGWSVPSNKISVLVREVCQAIVNEYLDVLMTPPSTPEVWREIANPDLQLCGLDLEYPLPLRLVPKICLL